MKNLGLHPHMTFGIQMFGVFIMLLQDTGKFVEIPGKFILLANFLHPPYFNEISTNFEECILNNSTFLVNMSPSLSSDLTNTIIAILNSIYSLTK